VFREIQDRREIQEPQAHRVFKEIQARACQQAELLDRY
jgi:hypothetical protein